MSAQERIKDEAQVRAEVSQQAPAEEASTELEDSQLEEVAGGASDDRQTFPKENVPKRG